MDTQNLISEIANACYFIRCYHRPCAQLQRAQAIQKLWEILRYAWSWAGEDHEQRAIVLTTLVDGLRPPDQTRF